MIRILSIFAINILILLSLLIRFFGILNDFSNSTEPNRYFAYKTIAAKQMESNVKAVVIIPEKSLKIIKIFKKPIGITKEGIVDAEGNLYDDSNKENLITVEGNYKRWPKYYNKLQNMNLYEKIYHVKVYDYRIDVWMQPGLLVQLDDHIENLQEFLNAFPEFFQKGTLIDLRCTKRVGISKIKCITKCITTKQSAKNPI